MRLCAAVRKSPLAINTIKSPAVNTPWLLPQSPMNFPRPSAFRGAPVTGSIPQNKLICRNVSSFGLTAMVEIRSRCFAFASAVRPGAVSFQFVDITAR